MKYHIALRIIHWLMALIIVGLIVVGFYMANIMDEKHPDRFTLYALHKSFGVTILALFVLRVVVRLSTFVPPLPATMPKLIQYAAHAGHASLYLLIFLVPAVGVVMSDMGGYGIKWFGIELPRLFETNKEIAGYFHASHEILAYVMAVVIAVHIAGVIKHRFFDAPEHDVLKRMV